MRSLVMLLLVLTLFLASAARAAGDVRILVVDLQAKGEVAVADAEIITGIVTTRLQRYRKVAVVSGADIREMIALEAQKQTTGCDDASCLSEVAGALGAELIVTGTVGRLGQRYVVTLNLIDVQNARAVARETVDLGSLSNAPSALRSAVDDLTAPMRERIGRPDDELTFVDAAQATLTWTGWSLAGIGAGTLLVQHAVFVITYLGLSSRPIDTAFFPVCGPFAVFLNDGVGAEPTNGDDISTVAFACCLCELGSCAMCLAAPAVLGSGAVVGLFDDEDGDKLAQDLLGPPPASPLSDEEREQLAAQMAY